jgi:hypothetical protein
VQRFYCSLPETRTTVVEHARSGRSAPVALVGGEVAFDPHFERLRYLLLAYPGAVGEEPPLQPASCAAAPGAKAVAARRLAARTAASTDAPAFKKFVSAIPVPP